MGATRDEATPHIRTDKLRKRYPKSEGDAVTDLCLSIERGHVFGILGPNGAGKTTTLAMLCGLIRPDGGTISYEGGRGPEAMRRRIGLVPQDLGLYSRLTARENLAFFGQLYGVGGRRLRRRIAALLDVAGLTDRADERIERYSSGMRRRLNLVAALVHEPEVVLLDEPTVGIDPQSRNRIFELVRQLGDQGVTLLYTTHYMEEAARLCDRVAIMDRGSILVEDTPGRLVRRLGSFRVELSVDAFPEAFGDGLRSLEASGEVTHDEGLLTIEAKDDEGAMAVVHEVPRLAEEHGVTVGLRAVVEPSLESVFLELTGRELRDSVE